MKSTLMLAWAAAVGGILLGVSWRGPTLAATGGGAASASRPATRAATATAPRAATVPVPSTAALALYRQITDKYTASQWDTLPPDLAKTRDIAAMTKEEQADVAYIRQALADGRPAWWDAVKQGKKLNLQTKIWQKTLNTTWDPSLTAGTISMQQTSTGQVFLALNWLSADMDSADIAEHGFTKGDLAYVGIWSSLETAQLYGSLALQKLSNLDEKEHTKLMRFLMFRGALAAGYYGTPRARRWDAFLACDGYQGAHLTNEGFIPRRPLAIMLEEEIVSHAPKYPSFRLPRNLQVGTVEAVLAVNLMGQFERTTLTFAEDKALRDAIKDFAQTNTTTIYAGGKVTLPSKLTVALDPAEDGDLGTKRGTWLMDEIAHPGIHAQPASKPATAPKP